MSVDTLLIAYLSGIAAGLVLFVLGILFWRYIERARKRRKQKDNLPRGDDGGVIPGHSSKAWIDFLNRSWYPMLAEQKAQRESEQENEQRRTGCERG